MAATLVRELHHDAATREYVVPRDTGARLSRALLNYVAALIAALMLLPFEFAIPETLRIQLALDAVPFLATMAMFTPYGFLSRRARGRERLAGTRSGSRSRRAFLRSRSK